MKETEAVLEAVRPHGNLEYLSIKRYVGDELSSWVFSLSNLKELSLYRCTLEYLYHERVKFESFLPCLETLKIKRLHNLKGWWREAAIPGDDYSISVSPSLSRVSKVFISDCPNLVEGMPLLKGIEELKLRRVNGKLVDKLLSTRTPNLKLITLSDVKDLSCLPKGSIKFLTSLKSLDIRICEELRWVSSCGLVYLTALEELEILCCGNVKLEDENEEIINNSSGLGMPWKALQRLRRMDVPWQRHLQEGLQYLTALKWLKMGYYEIKQVEEDNEIVEKERHLPAAIQALGIQFHCMPCSCFPKWIQRLRFLKELRFSACDELSMSWAMLANMNLQRLFFHFIEKVVNVDEMETEQQIQFSSLIELQIRYSQDGSWIHDIPWKLFQSLHSIKLESVGNLKKIPDRFKHLTSLQNLSLVHVRKIRERCKPETGEDWHLISHIPRLNTVDNLMSKDKVADGLDLASIFAYTMWWCWKWRNNRVFDEEVHVMNKASFILMQTKEYADAWHEDGRQGNEKRKEERLISWEKPPEGWVKLNTDGAVDRLGQAAAGGVVCDEQGRWLGGFAYKIGVCPVIAAELWGIVGGLKEVWRMGRKKVVVETDSMLAETLIKGRMSDRHPLSSLVQQCHGLLNREWEIRFQHVFREANGVADSLASYALNLPLGFISLNNPPSGSIQLLEEDARGRATPHLVCV